jgi:hypothetical protein
MADGGVKCRGAADTLICQDSARVVMINGWATLAQLVERLIRNQQVAGSIPAGGSIKSMDYRVVDASKNHFGSSAGCYRLF